MSIATNVLDIMIINYGIVASVAEVWEAEPHINTQHPRYNASRGVHMMAQRYK